MPASLRKQWSQELFEKFSLPSSILESRSYNEAKKQGITSPFLQDDLIVITSYEFAAAKAADVVRVQWDLIIFDEAHRLRNVYRRDGSQRAKSLRDATRPFRKLLLTATPLQNSLLELYGLVSVIDERFFSDEAAFRTAYPIVQSKVTAATKWCQAATDHGVDTGGKPWAYVLIPDNQILANASIAGLTTKFVSGTVSG